MATKEDTFEKFVELQHMMGALHHNAPGRPGPMADTTRGKGRVLALLKMADGLATKDMATVLGIRVSSLNETLARLEAQGYVERRPSEQDGRIMLVYLTESGRATKQAESDLPQRLFADFADDELAVLDSYLDRMSTALEAELGDNWREQMERRRNRRAQIFHQAHGHGGHRSHPERAKGARNHHGNNDGRANGAQGHAGNGSTRKDARYPRDAEAALCDHNCRACTREVCVRGMR